MYVLAAASYDIHAKNAALCMCLHISGMCATFEPRAEQ
jgi:hypothetical protein